MKCISTNGSGHLWCFPSSFPVVGFPVCRIRKGLPSEARVVSRILPQFLDDFFPPQDVMNKVIGEFLSNQQPYPQFMATVVYKVSSSSCVNNDIKNLCTLGSWGKIGLVSFIYFYFLTTEMLQPQKRCNAQFCFFFCSLTIGLLLAGSIREFQWSLSKVDTCTSVLTPTLIVKTKESFGFYNQTSCQGNLELEHKQWVSVVQGCDVN